ncbi:MAG: AI-2E family transporter [Parcubacteria group bacterium]|nr:AI-2E family transporter [Parcubacteria group bacterium]
MMDISWQSIWRFFLVLILILTIWFFRQIILFVLVAFIIASLLEIPINALDKKIKHRWLSSFIIYLITLLLIGFLIYASIPSLLEIIQSFRQNFNVDINSSAFLDLLEKWNLLDLGLNNQLLNVFLKSYSFLIKITGGAFSILFVFLLSFFLNTETQGIEKGLRLIVPKGYEDYVVSLWEKGRQKVSSWFYSQLILSFFVVLCLFIVLNILGIPHVWFLIILAGLLDFIPYIGPVIAGMVITFFGLSQGLMPGLLVLLFFVIIQFLENIIAPPIRARTMQMNPLMIILAILLGGKLMGAVGAIIALPITAILIELFRDIKSGKIHNYLPQKKLL